MFINFFRIIIYLILNLNKTLLAVFFVIFNIYKLNYYITTILLIYINKYKLFDIFLLIVFFILIILYKENKSHLILKFVFLITAPETIQIIFINKK